MKQNDIVSQILTELHSYADPSKEAFFPKFFKAGPGEYAEGDKFIGVTVPNQRIVAKNHAELSLQEILELLHDEIHEMRLVALFIMVAQFQRAAKAADFDKCNELHSLYLANTEHVNNWDLVDSSAQVLVGEYLRINPKQMLLLNRLAKSELLWERRIAIVATFAFIRQGELDKTYEIAELLLGDKHDLMHKAVGWAIREAGRKDELRLESFIMEHVREMSRTTLRYAIERFPEKRRKELLNL